MNRRSIPAFAAAILGLWLMACGEHRSQYSTDVEYAQRLHDESIAAQREVMHGPNQWDEFEAIMADLDGFLDEAKEADRAARPWNTELDDNWWGGLGIAIIKTVPNRGTPEQYAAEHARVLDMYRDFESRGFFDVTSRLPDLLVTMPPPQESALALAKHDLAGTTRAISRWQSARMRLAAEDDDARLASLHEALALGRALSWHGAVPNWMSGQLLVLIAIRDFLDSQLLHPTTIDWVLARADALIVLEGMQRTAGFEHAIRIIDHTMKDLIQRLYTAHGKLDIEAYDELFPSGFLSFDSPEPPYDDRASAEVWFDTLHELIMRTAHATGADVLPAHEEAKMHLESATNHSPIAKNLGTPPQIVFQQQSFDLHMAGARVMIAIERYRLEHGELPGSLDELGDLLPDGLRTDPLANEPWIYNPTAVSTAESGDPLRDCAVAWPYTLRSAPLPGVEPATEWHENPKGGALITVPIQGPKYDAPATEPDPEGN